LSLPQGKHHGPFGKEGTFIPNEPAVSLSLGQAGGAHEDGRAVHHHPGRPQPVNLGVVVHRAIRRGVHQEFLAEQRLDYLVRGDPRPQPASIAAWVQATGWTSQFLSSV
jgi:hypothetical protein